MKLARQTREQLRAHLALIEIAVLKGTPIGAQLRAKARELAKRLERPIPRWARAGMRGQVRLFVAGGL